MMRIEFFHSNKYDCIVHFPFNSRVRISLITHLIIKMLNIYITIIVNCIILNTVKVSFALTVLPNPTNVIPDIINNLTQYLSANSVTKLTPNQSAIDLCFMRTVRFQFQF